MGGGVLVEEIIKVSQKSCSKKLQIKFSPKSIIPFWCKIHCCSSRKIMLAEFIFGDSEM